MRFQRKRFLHLPHIPTHDPYRTEAKVGRLEHHVRRGDGGVDLTAALAVLRPHPTGATIIADEECRRCEMAARHGIVQLLPLFLCIDQHDALRLQIAGCRRGERRSEYLFELLRLNVSVLILQD